MSTKFFTNQKNNTLFDKFSGVFTHSRHINYFDVLVGYFRASGYFKIRPLLEKIANIRILVGIDADKLAANMYQQGLVFTTPSADEVQQNWQETFIEDVQIANYDQQTEQGILRFIEDIKTKKVQLKAHPSQKMHAKIYIFRPNNFNEHTPASVITGSSNLTQSGLGISGTKNYEFNVVLQDYADVKFASDEFERLWQEGIDILPEMVQSTKNKTYLQTITPYELYLKMLIEYFGDSVEFDPNSLSDLPADFKHLNYQADAVHQGWKMLTQHNGFFLADVVGLGKTVVATLIARQFYYHNGFPNYRSKILLIIPPNLKINWQTTLEKFSLDDAITFCTTGKLHQVVQNAKRYDLVIVDEAHKFRNDTSEAYDLLQRICKTKTHKNKTKKVILISATPLNNRPNDLYNQMLLFQDGNHSTLGFSLSAFFNEIKKQHQTIQKLKNKSKITQQTQALYERVREKVIEPLMVRRTRSDLENNDSYQKDLKVHNITFPKQHILKLYYKLPKKLEQLYDQTIRKIDNKKQTKTGLLYTRYRTLYYLKPALKKQYQQADFITEQLVAIMKTLLLKRMDSSFFAFRQTLGRFLQSSEAMLKMIDDNKIIIAPNLAVNEYILEDKQEELLELIATESLTDPSIIMGTKKDFDPEFILGVKHDHQMLEKLVKDWNEIKIDPKITKLKTQLPQLLDKQKNPEQKVIIFTESSDTMHYLSQQLDNYTTLGVNAQNIKRYKKIILENFDANYTKDKQKSQYQILITTDVLAEGVDLHRSNTVINYDTPWNATKLMQRIGRLNRIGTTASDIFVHNFYPTTQIDSDIELEKKALIKLQAFHSALGEDSQIYSDEEEVTSFGIFDQNIQAEKNLSLPFLQEIRNFRAQNPEDYHRLKKLPSKIRNAVKNQQLSASTLTFARTNYQESMRFYFVDKQNKHKNYSFIQSAKLLKCDPSVKTCTLPKHHHKQVQLALEYFEAELTEDILSQTHNKTLAPQEARAIKYLKTLHNLNSSEQEKVLLSQAIAQIHHKVFQNLTRNINKLQKNSTNIKPIIKPIVQLEKALAIIKQYDLNQPPTDTPQEIGTKNTKPTIIIAQSYV